MNIVLDVTDSIGQVAYARPGQVPQVITLEGRHAESLGPALWAISDGEMHQCRALGVVVGPGGFTGVRIGIALALGLARAHPIPIFGLDKFALMARMLFSPQRTSFGMVIPAGKRFCYLARFADGQYQRAPCVHLLEDEPGLQGEDWFTYTDASAFQANPLPCSPLLFFLELLQAKALQPSQTLKPFYLRPPDAKKGKSLLAKLLQSPPQK